MLETTGYNMNIDHSKLVEKLTHKTILLDFYRIALDFGLPAAERAMDLMDQAALPQQQSKLIHLQGSN